MKKIVAENFKYRYPLTKELALNDISFEIEKGEFIGVIGKNGAGKSTLCQALIGLVPQFYKGACGGKILVDGLDTRTTKISEMSSKVGLVFQNPFTQVSGAKLTVYEEVGFGLENNGVPRDAMKKRIDYALKLLDIYEYKDKNPFELSGGQMQRMAIASVIAMKPEVIVLDEPTSQLDPQGSEEVFKAVQTLSKQGMTVIMVEHKIEKIAKYSDRVMFMDEGSIIDFDTPEKIFSRDDIESRGAALPAFTKICRKLGIKDEKTGLYPTTLEDAYDLVVKNNG
ncbi:MAG: ATP-binding cassette domain-containing protein [Inconstantimicrobium porci]|uniref:energy-coupling factor ABC transporter ATP-binding protein n=1 Tax=Inconstantimicrobium porci TaxID=2652291 RepID=UPI0024090DB7|nr:ATP-binding cassette domain-containing protein [Inconstantimicrobium porci]MDD6769484.1 ATP-binding cassette domain-containing protein [Inconstantimicrobium porci]MDY5912542.1 ATP-binding cassette domain-containing protein [Inconstantimicrobium porci]